MKVTLPGENSKHWFRAGRHSTAQGGIVSAVIGGGSSSIRYEAASRLQERMERQGHIQSGFLLRFGEGPLATRLHKRVYAHLR
jgi:hypothetical protein